jgi:DNA-directed RNA polymerase subunit RPC12/RpoP
MIIISEVLAASAAMRPVKCPKCGHRRVFEAPAGACVRKSRRGKPPHEPAFILTCKRCGQAVGISFE